MKRGTEPFLRPLKRHEVPNMENVLPQLERSGCIYFMKTLSKTAIRCRETAKIAMLSLPEQFVRENAEKIEEWVILRTHSSCGGSGRPWTVRLSVTEAGKVLFCDGFYAFVTDNRLREGDSLIFVLREDARSEFEVYMFRGSQEGAFYADEGDSTSCDEENNSHSSFPSPLHHQNERKNGFKRDFRKGEVTKSSQLASHFDYHRVHKKVHTSDMREGRATPSQLASHFDYHRVHKKVHTSDTSEGRATALQFANHWQIFGRFPSFRKRLTGCNIGRSDRDPRTNSGQFEFPERFVRTHDKTIQTPVKLQGIHEHSPSHVITCRRRPGTRVRIDLHVTGWSRFVKENGLEKGHELEFSLMSDSYFLVRKVD